MKIAIVGLGTMGQAIVRGLVASKSVNPKDLRVYDHGASKRAVADSFQVTWCPTIEAAVQEAQHVIVAVKPKDYAAVCTQLQPLWNGTRTLISIAGGLKLADLAQMVSPDTPVIRVMPNTPVAFRAGLSIICAAPTVAPELVVQITQLFSLLGQTVALPENLMDCATALAGCGPAFVYQMLEGLADGAVALGLPRATAYQVGAQMICGAAVTARESGEHPGKLKDDVTTPGGSTIKGVLSLEDDGVRSAFAKAIIAASK